MQERDEHRRLRPVPALEPVDLPGPRVETAATILPGVPRVGALDALLREVDDLRLTLETDLTLAAAAVEAGIADAAVEIINKDIDDLHQFEDSALGHLTELADAEPSEPTEPQSRSRDWSRFARVSTAPFVAAAAVVGLLIGVIPNSAAPAAKGSNTVSAQSSLQELTSLAAQGRTMEVRVAALELHDQIRALVGRAPDNHATAQQALLLLSYERNVIVQSGDSAALHDVLVLSAALAAKIRGALPSSLRTAVPAVPAILAPAPSAPPRKQTKSRPTASPTPSARASQRQSQSPSPKPTPTPTASPRPSASEEPPSGKPFLPYADPEPTPSSLD